MEASQIPLRQRAIGLPVDPGPSQFHGDATDPAVARPTDSLLVLQASAPVRGRAETCQTPHLAAIFQAPPGEELVGVNRRRPQTNRFESHQLPGLFDARTRVVVSNLGSLHAPQLS